MRFSHKHITIHYRKVGHGPHLSFLHGFCENATLWDALIAELQDSYTCLSIDLPGFGASEINDQYSMEELATCILALWEHLDIHKSIVLGHSMGGYVALEMLAQQPDAIRGLGLIHSTAKADSEEKKESRRKVIQFLQKQPTHLFLQQFYPQLVASAHVKRLAPILWELVKDSPAEAISAACLAMLGRKDHRKTMQSHPIPYLFLTGDHDTHFTAEEIYEQASLCQLADVVLIPGAGHLSLLEEPEKSSKAIKDYLRFVMKMNGL